MKRYLFLIAIIAILISPLCGHGSPLDAGSREIVAALNYFKSNQQDDGGFGPGGKTEWVMMAIASAGQDPRRWYRNGRTPIDYLRTLKITDNPWDWIRMVLVLTALGENPREWQGTNFVGKIKAHYQNGQFGDILSLRDDFWAVIALAAAGEAESSLVADSVRFILKHQNEDGSWGASTTGIEIGADNTATAIIALLAAGKAPDCPAIIRGKSYLGSIQSSDGGFPYLFVPSNAATDAFVIQALSTASENPLTVNCAGRNVVAHLLGLQEPDGSFRWTETSVNSSLMMTAYALPALLGKSYPIRPVSSPWTTVEVRIEGKDGTVLHQPVTTSSPFPTPISLLTDACKQAGIDHEIIRQGDVLYVLAVQGQRDVWQYRVNDLLPMVAADAFRLGSGDELVWFYDPEGCKSPLRLQLQPLTCCTGESSRVLVEQFEDDTGAWKECEDCSLVVGDTLRKLKGGVVSIQHSKEGAYPMYAEKQDGVRSRKKVVTVEQCSSIRVNVCVEDNGQKLWQGMVACSEAEITDMNGELIAVHQPVLLLALEGARRSSAIDYKAIRTAQGVILVSINGLSEDNEHGSWWYEVNGRKVKEDVDAYTLKEGDKVLFYRSLQHQQ
jgi:prenyltransferase beta subunit